MASSRRSQLTRIFGNSSGATAGGFTTSDEEEGLGRSPTTAPAGVPNEEKLPNTPTKTGSKRETDGAGPSRSSVTPWIDPSRIGPGDTVIPEDDVHLRQLNDEIRGVTEELQERKEELARVKDAAERGVSFGGEVGDSLREEEHNLRQERRQLQKNLWQLREEKRLRHQSWGWHQLGSTGESGPRVSVLINASSVGDTEVPREALVGTDTKRSSHSSSEHKPRSIRRTIGVDEQGGLVSIFCREEDGRLPTRLDSFANPILVSTLMTGFCLVLFEYSSREITKQLAVAAFALEMAASTTLSAIAFHGQQQYYYSTNMFPKTHEFLTRIRPVTFCALFFFAAGVLIFVGAFAMDVAHDLGFWWTVTFGVLFFPSIVAGVVFMITVEIMRRLSRAEIAKKVKVETQ